MSTCCPAHREALLIARAELREVELDFAAGLIGATSELVEAARIKLEKLSGGAGDRLHKDHFFARLALRSRVEKRRCIAKR